MEPIDNNQFEIIPSGKAKRKITAPSTNAYMNPALDLLSKEDRMCNTAMEIAPIKKKKRAKSLDVTGFENTALDLGISRAAVNNFLVQELENVRKNTMLNVQEKLSLDAVNSNYQNNCEITFDKSQIQEPVYDTAENVSQPIYENINSSEYGSILPQKVNKMIDNIPVIYPKSILLQGLANNSLNNCSINQVTNIINSNNESININNNSINQTSNINNTSIKHTTNIINNIFINNSTTLNLSFIDRLALDSPSLTSQSLYLDDDLNESNIMEIKTINFINNTQQPLENIKGNPVNTNPFLNCDDEEILVTGVNPFLDIHPDVADGMEYNDMMKQEAPKRERQPLEPRRLFEGESSSTISTVNESYTESEHEYENIDNYRIESPIYENVSDENYLNKQSKILGCDVSHFSAQDIMNLNKKTKYVNDSAETRKNTKNTLVKVGNKISKNVFKTLKKKFKTEKEVHNTTLNPYEVPRKAPKKKTIETKESGIENPALNLDNSDEVEIEELESEHQYETIKTLRNTKLNINITPLKERNNEPDLSLNKSHTPGKKVRFDSTLNQEKVITGNSFDFTIQSPGFDAKLDKFHDELENDINERKYLQQNL